MAGGKTRPKQRQASRQKCTSDSSQWAHLWARLKCGAHVLPGEAAPHAAHEAGQLLHHRRRRRLVARGALGAARPARLRARRVAVERCGCMLDSWMWAVMDEETAGQGGRLGWQGHAGSSQHPPTSSLAPLPPQQPLLLPSLASLLLLLLLLLIGLALAMMSAASDLYCFKKSAPASGLPPAAAARHRRARRGCCCSRMGRATPCLAEGWLPAAAVAADRRSVKQAADMVCAGWRAETCSVPA